MALPLIVKRLLQQGIGTHVELFCPDETNQLVKYAGVITDSDFTSGIELTTESGEVHFLDATQVKRMTVTKTVETVLKGLAPNTRIRFAYTPGEDMQPSISATVIDNDGIESLELRLDSNGAQEFAAYCSIGSVLLCQDAAPQPVPRKTALYEQKPDSALNGSDLELKTLFDQMPRDDRVLLGGSYNSFRFGVKNNDRSKMAAAAAQASQLFMNNYERYYSDPATARFCGLMLRRTNVYDSEVFLVGKCFREAALVFYQEQNYPMCAAYSLLALLDPDLDQVHDQDIIRDLFIIHAIGMTNADDVSGLRILRDNLPTGMEPMFQDLIESAFRFKGISYSASQPGEDPLLKLETLYPDSEIAPEVLFWLPKQPEMQPEPEPEPEPTKIPEVTKGEPEFVRGRISKLNWADHTGFITADSGDVYTFRYTDISNPTLLTSIEKILRSDLNGKTFLVKFKVSGTRATEIQSDNALVDKARSICADRNQPNRFLTAYDLYVKALDTPDVRRALSDLIKCTITIYKNDHSRIGMVEKAMELYEKHITALPDKPDDVMNVAQCYCYLKKYLQMIQHGRRSLAYPQQAARQKMARMGNYLRMVREYFDISADADLLREILDMTDKLWSDYSGEFNQDQQSYNIYRYSILPSRIFAECNLDMLQEAKDDLSILPADNSQRCLLEDMLRATQERLSPPAPTEPASDAAPDEAPVPEDTDTADDDAGQTVTQDPPDVQPEPAHACTNTTVPFNEEAEAYAEEYTPDDLDEYDSQEETPAPELSYVDEEGWDSLGLTPQDVIDYALSIPGEDNLPAVLAYLRAGSALCDQITPIYRTVALAANDPMESPDYSVDALFDAVSHSDSNYPDLNNYCLGAAFLRSSFIAGRGYGFTVRELRSSISITQDIPALSDVYDTLESFRKGVGLAIDIYADYRNRASKQIREDLRKVVRHADELYTKFILTEPREGVKFARLLDTKKLVFARDGYLATMLSYIINQKNDALESERTDFISKYLNSNGLLSPKSVSANAVDAMVTHFWDLAGKNLQFKKESATLQGNRRNNLRSNISDILRTICQWYAIAEQSAGLTWKTPEGEACYQALRPRLLEQLHQVSQECTMKLEQPCSNEQRIGLLLLSGTAREMAARVDGSWQFDQEKYLYTDFLRSDCVMLDDDFMPDLRGTFCALSKFNILARIRRHVESPKATFQERINRIYSMDKTSNNYGCADKIIAYLSATGTEETVDPPENAELFIYQTRLQVDMRYRAFLEQYALSKNYGQIMDTDHFCSNMEETVRYWYKVCTDTRNYGFFNSFLLQAENQIHASAQQYEAQLNKQLDTLISTNQQQFDAHPGYAEAIRVQISQQNFLVAEDWMHRIRQNDFSLELTQPEALKHLDHFWKSYAVNYSLVSETDRSLSSQLVRRTGTGGDNAKAQALIDNWLKVDKRSNTEQIDRLLTLLGWKNIRVNTYNFVADQNAELYEVRQEPDPSGVMTPQHPIAAFGSNLMKKKMIVLCLYGAHDCDRIYAKLQALDAISGSKVVLLDHALGNADRRALARKLRKKENSLRNVCIIIDRVLICHLANIYNESMVNRILMATAMPFTYCQPYVVDSSQTMPPEIFIGRKDELQKIEQSDGVNLIYGGRQLGKSALFKKALFDLDGKQNQRAVLVDIKELNCPAAARALSAELIDRNLIPDMETTDDWDLLCRNIERRLRDTNNEITYFLVMLDEADTFIDDCARYGYRPLVALKKVQQSLPGQFKYVLAGLHNTVKFNRQVALGNNSVIPHMSSLKITPFRSLEGQELLSEPLSYLGFSLPSKVTVSQILATVNYFPGLIQLYCQKLIESMRAPDYAGYDVKKTPPFVVTDDHLRRVMADKEFVEQIHSKFEATLTVDQDQGSWYYPLTLVMGLMYYMDPDKNAYTAEDVMKYAESCNVRSLMELDEEKIETLMQELQDLNILRSVSNDSYLLASKNFRDLLGSESEILKKLDKLEEQSKAGGVAE